MDIITYKIITYLFIIIIPIIICFYKIIRLYYIYNQFLTNVKIWLYKSNDSNKILLFFYFVKSNIIFLKSSFSLIKS